MNNKTVLLTGGLGKIGWRLGKALFERGYRVIILDNTSHSNPKIPTYLKTISRHRITIIEGDVRDKEVLRDIFSKWMIDSVIHLAGLTSVNQSLVSPLPYFENNVTGSLHLLEVMTEFRVFKLIVASSAAIYEPSQHALTEDSLISPQSPYAASKAMLERILEHLSCSDANWIIVSLRFFNPIFTEVVDASWETVVNPSFFQAIQQVLQGKKASLSLYGQDFQTEDGTAVRDFFHSQDLVMAHCQLLEHFPKMPGYYFYNIGSGRGASLKEVVDLFRAKGYELPIVYEPRREGDLSVSVADITKFSEEFDWSPGHSLSDIVDHILEGFST